MTVVRITSARHVTTPASSVWSAGARLPAVFFSSLLDCLSVPWRPLSASSTLHELRVMHPLLYLPGSLAVGIWDALTSPAEGRSWQMRLLTALIPTMFAKRYLLSLNHDQLLQGCLEVRLST